MDEPRIPVVPVSVERGRTAWHLRIDKCPHCGQKHSHGGGPVVDAPQFGHRVSHCGHEHDNAMRGYMLVPDEPNPVRSEAAEVVRTLSQLSPTGQVRLLGRTLNQESIDISKECV